MVTTVATAHEDTPPRDVKLLADWLAPRDNETYEEWSRRFDNAARLLDRERHPATIPHRTRRRGSQPGLRAA